MWGMQIAPQRDKGFWHPIHRGGVGDTQRQCRRKDFSANRSFHSCPQTPLQSVDTHRPTDTHGKIACVFWFWGWPFVTTVFADLF